MLLFTSHLSFLSECQGLVHIFSITTTIASAVRLYHYCIFSDNCSGRSLRGGTRGFPSLLRTWPPATFKGKQKKNRTKRNPYSTIQKYKLTLDSRSSRESRIENRVENRDSILDCCVSNLNSRFLRDSSNRSGLCLVSSNSLSTLDTRLLRKSTSNNLCSSFE